MSPDRSRITLASVPHIRDTLNWGPFILPMGPVTDMWEGPVIQHQNGHPPHEVALFLNQGSLLPDWRRYSIAPPVTEWSYYNEGSSSYCSVVTETGEFSVPFFVISTILHQYDEDGERARSFGDAIMLASKDATVLAWLPACEPVTLARLVLPYIINGLDRRAIWVKNWEPTA